MKLKKTRRQLAMELAISVKTLWGWETDRWQPTTHRLPLTEAARGYEIFEQMKEDCRKVVLLPGMTAAKPKSGDIFESVSESTAANTQTKPTTAHNNMKKNSTKQTENETSGDENVKMDTELHELFLDELADLLNAETQLTKALPKMAKAAESSELKEAFTSHLEETQNHITRLQDVFTSLDEKVKSKTCKAMKGLLEEGSELMQELKGKSTIDAGLIAAAQKVEHYEIASYGTVIAWAEQMGHSEAVDLLTETLDEEKAADEKLTEIAEEAANDKGQ